MGEDIPDVLTSNQIRNCLRFIPAFQGVFAHDTLPSHGNTASTPAAWVMNTHYAKGEGQHWCCIIKEMNHHIWYFDSFGLPPVSPYFIDFIQRHNQGKGYSWNDTPLQSIDSGTCGKYVCLYIYYRLYRHFSHTQFIDLFQNTHPDMHVRILFQDVWKRCLACPSPGDQKCYKYGDICVYPQL